MRLASFCFLGLLALGSFAFSLRGQEPTASRPNPSVEEEQAIYEPVDKNGRPLEPAKPAVSPHSPEETTAEENPQAPSVLQAPSAPKIHTITSTSGQFIVSGYDKRQCSTLSRKGEEIRQSFIDFLKEDGKNKTPIYVKLVGRYGDVVSPSQRISTQLEILIGLPSFVITVPVGNGVEEKALRTKIIETLIYERALRQMKTQLIPDSLHAPSWMILGFDEALLWKENKADRHLYSLLFERGEILPLEKIFAVKAPELELDATSQGIYRASSGALVLCLMNQGGGNEAFKRLLNQSLFNGLDSATLLKQNFPGLHLSKNSLHKWWSLQLAGMASLPLTESYGIIASEQKLKELLTLSLYEESKKAFVEIPPLEYEKLLELHPKVRKSLIDPVLASLLQLSYRVFPTQRALVVDYMTLLTHLSLGTPPADWKNTIKELEKLRTQHYEVGKRSRDYLDWLTIVSSSGTTTNFEAYSRTLQLLREQQKPQSNPMREYLEAIENLLKED